uniref:Retrotransposon gag domain-containing protein n=1 Tax=Nicotiana tabacum TaxID=4097 RepID=A0A1S3Z9C8_TOBAC|nr:PREDICTED: uncharacterized protein LOC107784442 [Nicotiana tabacum]
MTDNIVNIAHNFEALGNPPQREDSISDTCNEEDVAMPAHHITTYKTTVKGNDLAPHGIELVLLKKFGETLKKRALTWHLLLPEHSIDSFEMLANSFGKAHVEARNIQAWKADKFRISHGESELLREFMTRFQKERMLLPVVLGEWAVEAFTKGLNLRNSNALQKLKESLLEFQATTWADVHKCYESKIRIEDDKLRFPASTKGRDQQNNRDKSKDDFDADQRSSKGRFLPYKRPKDAVKCSDRRIVQLVSVIRNITEARFPRSMRFDPNQRDPNLWCEYHGNNSHHTGDYRHLGEEMATLLKNGHLREFLCDRVKNNYGRNQDNVEP